jgi:hypothetical protein
LYLALASAPQNTEHCPVSNTAAIGGTTQFMERALLSFQA